MVVAKSVQQWADYVHAIGAHPVVYARTLFSSPSTEFGRALKIFTAFVRSIDVTSPYIIGLLVFHVATFFALLSQRSNEKGLAAITVLLGAVLVGYQAIDAQLSLRVPGYAKASSVYADSHDVFFATAVLLPVLVNATAAIALLIRAVSDKVGGSKKAAVAARTRSKSKKNE